MNNSKNIFPLIALRGLVVFPYVIASFEVGREATNKALDYAQKHNNLVFLVSQKDERLENITTGDIYSLGTIAKIRQVTNVGNNGVKVVIEGISRAEVLDIEQMSPYISKHLKMESLKGPHTRCGVSQTSLLR